MTVREVLTSENRTLRIKAQKVRSFTPHLQTLIDDMIETLRAAPGVGLAATQVGAGQRVVVVEYGEPSEDPDKPDNPPKLYVLVNPEIVRHSAETVLGTEACLSVPGFFGEVERYQWATVKGLNRHGRPFRVKAGGWLARIFQHEIDHLDGVLYIDRATRVWPVEEGSPAEAIAAD
jgi:peptide deformylase